MICAQKSLWINRICGEEAGLGIVINESIAQLKTSREARQTWPCHAHGAVLRSHTESLSDLLRFDQNECDLEHGSYRGWRLQTPGDGNNPSCNKNLSSVMGSTTQTCSDHI